MEFTYSTLFNIDYIDKGIALYNSIRRYNEKCRIYVLCLDNDTLRILSNIGLSNIILIPLSDLENRYDYLLKLKHQRSFAEYCWTLTPHIIEYVFDIFQEEYNTYLDSDLYFWSDPDEINIEMINYNCHTLITDHRFPAKVRAISEKKHGRFCVQFNSFTNSNESRELLRIWKEDVVLDCEYNKRKQKAGDQKYLEKFPKLSDGVFIPEHIGIGVAPWNISQYLFISNNNGKIMIANQNQQGQLIFYHFQNIKYITERIVNIGAGRADRGLKRIIYLPYLMEIENIRNKLKSYYIQIKPRSLSRNHIISIIQKYLMRYKIRYLSFSDIIYLPKTKRPANN